MSAHATARGTLGGTPLSNLLVYALDRGLTGTLVVEDAQGKKCGIRLKAGVPRKVKLSEPVERLGDLLIASGALNRITSDDVLSAAQAARILFGKELLNRGLVDPETLDATLAEQLIRKLEWMTALGPESVFGYYDGADFLESYGGTGVIIDPLEVIWRVLRKMDLSATVDGVLARLGGADLRLHPGSRVARFGFDARERGLLDVIRMKPQPLAALLASELLPAPHMKRVLYALVVTRHLDLGGTARPLGVDSQSSLRTPGSSSPPPAAVGARAAVAPPAQETRSVPAAPPDFAPSPPSPGADRVGAEPPGPRPKPAATTVTSRSVAGDAELRSEILRMAEQLDALDHYEILGVTRETSSAAIQGVFFQLAKRWHPDRIAADLADVRDLASRVFARMSEAHQTLSSDELRAAYDASRATSSSEAGEQEAVQKVLLAATAFQKAEILIRREQMDAAEVELRFAVENDPDQAEYAALLADLQSQKLERQPNPDFAPFVRQVNDARKREPQNKRVRLYRARVLRRAGDMEGAVREWRGLLEMDPHNVEAARELRLHEMRRGKQEAKPDASSGSDKDVRQFFGKLFKR